MIQTISRVGSEHQFKFLNNQDNFFVKDFDNYVVGAVLDGCSSGINSEFASQYVVYILNNLFVFEKDLKTNSNYFNLIDTILVETGSIMYKLHLSPDYFLTTFVFFLYNKNTNMLRVKFFGDGLVSYFDGERQQNISNDQENMPDYFAYLLNSDNLSSDIKKYISRNSEFVIETKDFSVLTDGIFTWKHNKDGDLKFNHIEYLTEKHINNTPTTNSLVRKYNILKRDKWEHYDDFTMIRVINND